MCRYVFFVLLLRLSVYIIIIIIREVNREIEYDLLYYASTRLNELRLGG